MSDVSDRPKERKTLRRQRSIYQVTACCSLRAKHYLGKKGLERNIFCFPDKTLTYQ